MLFKSFTGLSVQQFDDIFKEIESTYDKYEIKRLSSRKERREIAVGAGRHFKILVKDRVIKFSVYYMLYITYTLMEFLFGLDQSNVCSRDIQKIERLIRRCLPIPQILHKATKRLKTKEEVEEYFPGFLAFVDCTEQPIPRPKNRLRRRLYYSGKKKKHTVKNLYTTNQKGLLIYKTKHKQRGRRYDYRIYKKNHPDLPKDVMSMYDRGFLGVEKDFPEHKSLRPIKKEKDCELTVQGKKYNKNHSAKRIAIEHAICRIKKVQDNE